MKTSFIRFFVLIFLFIPAFTFGQNRPLIIHPKTGSKIDREKNNKYKFFHAQNNFDSAVFYRTSEGTCFAKLYIRRNDKQYENILHCTDENIGSYFAKVEYQNEMEEGEFRDEVKVYFDSTECCYFAKLSIVKFDLLPHIKKYKPDNEYKYKFAVGFSYNYYSPDFSSISDFFYRTETEITNYGYPVPHLNPNTNLSSFFNFHLKGRLYKTVWSEFDAGFGINSDVKAWRVSGTLKYRHDFEKYKWLKPFLGVGLDMLNYRLEVKYNSTLEYIQSYGHRTGVLFTAGTEMFLSNSTEIGTAVNIYMKYSLLQDITANTTCNYTEYNFGTSSAKLKGLSLGVGLNIYF